MCDFFGTLSEVELQILLALEKSVRIIKILCDKGLWESKDKYLSICIIFLYTFVVSVPFSLCMTSVSVVVPGRGSLMVKSATVRQGSWVITATRIPYLPP